MTTTSSSPSRMPQPWRVSLPPTASRDCPSGRWMATTSPPATLNPASSTRSAAAAAPRRPGRAPGRERRAGMCGGPCVYVRGASSAIFTPVQVYTCNGTGAQRWTVAAGNTLQALGKCMDINGGGTGNGTTVDLYDCNGTGAQVWQPQSGGALYNPQSGKCLDDTGWSTTPGTQLQIWSCSGNANQHWALP